MVLKQTFCNKKSLILPSIVRIVIRTSRNFQIKDQSLSRSFMYMQAASSAFCLHVLAGKPARAHGTELKYEILQCSSSYNPMWYVPT